MIYSLILIVFVYLGPQTEYILWNRHHRSNKQLIFLTEVIVYWCNCLSVHWGWQIMVTQKMYDSVSFRHIGFFMAKTFSPEVLSIDKWESKLLFRLYLIKIDKFFYKIINDKYGPKCCISFGNFKILVLPIKCCQFIILLPHFFKI